MEVDDLDNNSVVALPSDSEGNQEDIDNGIAIGEEIGRQRLSANTIKKYQAKINQFKEFVRVNYPLVYADRDVILADITPDSLLAFYGNICQRRNRQGELVRPLQFYAYEHVSGYRSAITEYYKMLRIEIPYAIKMQQNVFFGGNFYNLY